MIGGFVLGSTIFLPFVFDVGFPNYWIIAMTAGVIFPLLRMILVLKDTKETPAYWLRQNNYPAAKDVVTKLYPEKNCNSNEITQEEYSKIISWWLKKESDLISANKEQKNDKSQDPKKNRMQYKGAIISVYIWFFNQFTGLQGINIYSGKIFRLYFPEDTTVLISIS